MRVTTLGELRDIMGNAPKAKRSRKPKQIPMFGDVSADAKKTKRKRAIQLVDIGPVKTHTLTEPVTIRIPVEPVQWKAAKFSSTKGGRAGYRDKKLQAWYDHVVPLIKQQWMPLAPIGHMIAIDVEFYVSRDRIRVDDRATAPAGSFYCDKPADLSNYMKSCEDACTLARVWLDDALVVRFSASKRYHAIDEESRIVLRIDRVVN